MSEPVFQLHCWFEGRVQGVGFRYQTSRLARGFEVTGEVENLSDGRVHLFAEGAEAEVRGFVEEVGRELASYIRGTETKEARGPRRCRDFHIGPR